MTPQELYELENFLERTARGSQKGLYVFLAVQEQTGEQAMGTVCQITGARMNGHTHTASFPKGETYFTFPATGYGIARLAELFAIRPGLKWEIVKFGKATDFKS